ncbi:MAG: polysaccharide deacetylase family protein [Candidatus Omnitrophica bacterium]|nr:polysaccharide deacetylase family protein [Candidatus Omnitrophota bacterium]
MKISYHMDMDSPRPLLNFWGYRDVPYSNEEMDAYYRKAMDEALNLFSDCGIKITFFCVGEDLEKSPSARESVLRAHREGHEIANHSYSHPFGLTTQSEDQIAFQIDRAADLIQEVTGVRPVGFRSPSYEMNNEIMDMLEERSYLYDGSAFWSRMNVPYQIYHWIYRQKGAPRGFGSGKARIPHRPYFPSKSDWMTEGEPRRIMEIPMARTRIFHLPFYSNFHLSIWDFYKRLAVPFFRQPYIAYLFHLIEFADLSRHVPPELAVHPNVKMPLEKKLKSMRKTIGLLKSRYETVVTADYAREFTRNKIS